MVGVPVAGIATEEDLEVVVEDRAQGVVEYLRYLVSAMVQAAVETVPGVMQVDLLYHRQFRDLVNDVPHLVGLVELRLLH